MARTYCHISEYEKEIIELKEEGYTKREIGQRLGFTEKQIHNFITRINRNKRKMTTGVPVRKKGRPVSREMNPKTDKLFIHERRCKQVPSHLLCESKRSFN